MPRARHIEVQLVGDGTGAVAHLWERECSVQRERQKLIEIAPAPFLHPAVREKILRAATTLAAAASYLGVGTFEFLLDASTGAAEATFAFIEANARLQVEHTVTEEVTRIDLVRAQIEIAQGCSLEQIGLRQEDIAAPRGMALQARVNLESMGPDGRVRPGGGVLSTYEPPSGPGVRVDGYGYAGYRTNPRFDSLLAKVIVHAASGRIEDAASKAYRALSEFRIAGAPTNIGFLQALLRHPALIEGRTHTRFVEEHAADLGRVADSRYFEPAGSVVGPRLAGARIDAIDPLAVVHYGKAAAIAADDPIDEVAGPEGTIAVPAPMQGTVVVVRVAEGDAVAPGQEILVMEAMKMQHGVVAKMGGIVRAVTVALGDTVFENHPHLYARHDGEATRLRARMFAPLGGTIEDPATGSANATLAALLTALAPEVNVTLDYDIEQGIEMRRPSRLLATARKTGEGPVTATIAGDCVPMLRGWLEV